MTCTPLLACTTVRVVRSQCQSAQETASLLECNVHDVKITGGLPRLRADSARCHCQPLIVVLDATYAAEYHQLHLFSL